MPYISYQLNNRSVRYCKNIQKMVAKLFFFFTKYIIRTNLFALVLHTVFKPCLLVVFGKSLVLFHYVNIPILLANELFEMILTTPSPYDNSVNCKHLSKIYSPDVVRLSLCSQWSGTALLNIRVIPVVTSVHSFVRRPEPAVVENIFRLSGCFSQSNINWWNGKRILTEKRYTILKLLLPLGKSFQRFNKSFLQEKYAITTGQVCRGNRLIIWKYD